MIRNSNKLGDRNGVNMDFVILLSGLLVAITFNLMMSSKSEKNKDDKKIKVKDVELIFSTTKDIDKFIDEYRELIIWLDNKYPTFNEDIKRDWWIQRIIKEHDEVLVDLRCLVKDEERTSEILEAYKGNNK